MNIQWLFIDLLATYMIPYNHILVQGVNKQRTGNFYIFYIDEVQYFLQFY